MTCFLVEGEHGNEAGGEPLARSFFSVDLRGSAVIIESVQWDPMEQITAFVIVMSKR